MSPVGKSHYEVLGVQENASSEEVKRAFRKLAAAHHPDVGGDAAKFRELNDAYQVLSDDAKRAAYDLTSQLEGVAARIRKNRDGMPPIDPRGPNVYDKFVEDLFGGLWTAHPGSPGAQRKNPSAPAGIPRQERGDDILTEMILTLEESLKGCKKNIRVSGPRPSVNCGVCGGNGSQPGTRRVPCGSCAGHGRHVGFGPPHGPGVRTCPACRGAGSVPIVPCQPCKGTGRTTYVRELSVSVPSGIAQGQQLRIAGMGTPGHPPGDLYIDIRVRTGHDFWREGQDMHTSRKVSMRHAILGGPVHIEGPDGRECEVVVPPGTQPGDLVKVPGGGVTGALGGTRGDLVVHVVVQLPKALSARARKLLEELSEELTRGVPKDA